MKPFNNASEAIKWIREVPYPVGVRVNGLRMSFNMPVSEAEAGRQKRLVKRLENKLFTR